MTRQLFKTGVYRSSGLQEAKVQANLCEHIVLKVPVFNMPYSLSKLSSFSSLYLLLLFFKQFLSPGFI